MPTELVHVKNSVTKNIKIKIYHIIGWEGERKIETIFEIFLFYVNYMCIYYVCLILV